MKLIIEEIQDSFDRAHFFAKVLDDNGQIVVTNLISFREDAEEGDPYFKEKNLKEIIEWGHNAMQFKPYKKTVYEIQG